MKIFITDQGVIRGENPNHQFLAQRDIFAELTQDAKDHSIEFEDQERVKTLLRTAPRYLHYSLFPPGIYTVSLPEVEMVEQIMDMESEFPEWNDRDYIEKWGKFEYRTVLRFVERKEEKDWAKHEEAIDWYRGYREKRKGLHKKLLLVWNGVHENRTGHVVELEDQAVIYIDGDRDELSEVERKEEIIESEMKYFEVYCLNFSKVIHADSLFSAVLEFVKDHPLERVILAEDTVLFHLAKELTPSESQEEPQEAPLVEQIWWRAQWPLNEFKKYCEREQFTISRRTKPDSQK